jgi:hypothetical protein
VSIVVSATSRLSNEPPRSAHLLRQPVDVDERQRPVHRGALDGPAPFVGKERPVRRARVQANGMSQPVGRLRDVRLELGSDDRFRLASIGEGSSQGFHARAVQC